jgi:DUF4097 and DUF4098 domain-containing protein YvlB
MGRQPTVIPVAGATTVRVTTQSGSVTVVGEDRSDVLVERGAEAVTSGAQGIEVVGRSGKVEVRCPAGTDVFVGTASGSISLQGRLGQARVTTESGAIEIDQVGGADARTASGSIEVRSCDAACRCHSQSGDLRVGRAGSVDLATVSGGIDAGAVGSATVHAGSGTVTLGVAEPGTVDVDAHSGSVTITVPKGQHPATDLHAASGAVRCDCAPGTDGAVRVTTRSGSVTVTER